MEQWDRELEQRVWRRVRGENDGQGDLRELIGLSYAQLEDLKQVDGELYRLERHTAALLTGLHNLTDSGGLPKQKPRPGSRRQKLQRCRERCGRMLQLMLALEIHDRYGPVFTELTRQQRAKCARLEQLVSGQPGRRKGDSVTDFSPHRRRGGDYPGW